MDDPTLGHESAVSALAKQAALKRARDMNRPDPSEAELEAIARDAEAKNVYGFDAKKNRNGEYQEQGIGSPGHETGNHFAALRKRESQGLEAPGAYDRAVREIWKRDPDRARKISLPEPARAS